MRSYFSTSRFEWASLCWVWPLVVLLFYKLTFPENQSEAEDVYDFAFRVEQGKLDQLVGMNRLLALPIFAGIYQLVEWMNEGSRAFEVLVGLNQLLAVASLGLFKMLMQQLFSWKYSGSDLRLFSGMSTGLVAVSYGFWRYANSAETYMLAIFFMLLSWYFIRCGSPWKGALTSGVGILVHLLNVVPLLFAVGFYYLLKKRFRAVAVHGLIVGIVVLIGYGLFWGYLETDTLGAQHHRLEGGLSLSNGLRGLVAFGQCVVSANFLFGFEWFRELLGNFFPSRMLDEEFYMATHMADGVAIFGIFSLVFVVISAIRSIRMSRPVASHRSTFFMLIVWLVLYAIVVIRTEAGSVELWIMALIPFWLSISHFLSPKHMGWLLVGLLLHNGIAGVFPIRDSSTDYHWAKSERIMQLSDERDLVLIDYEPILHFYLRYYDNATVICSADYSKAEVEDQLLNWKGTVWTVNSFFKPMESLKMRYPAMFKHQIEIGQQVKDLFVQVETNSFGGIYRKCDFDE
jgi:hypothetical protein